ncbi:hypothetical protein OIV83_003747 [Microbotryomycetes sp. JL201]|nr:hypothetical protein OIV83_003747 [Microbotryomycetes sp. JL201]
MTSWSSASGVSDHRQASKHGFGLTLIHKLPTEVLAHVFAHLPPSSLSTAQRVCRNWHHVIADEASWRNAFQVYYGINERRILLGRRIDLASWRGEYVSRVAILNRWSKSRTPSLTYNANVGPIAAMHVVLPFVTLPSHFSKPTAPSKSANVTPSLLAVSLQTQSASVSTPFTGKTAKGLLQATPSDNLGRTLHLAFAPVSCAAISPDGSKIIWGMSDGSLRFSNCPGTAQRGWTGGTIDRNDVRVVQGHRQGTQITAIAFSNVDTLSRPDLFATTGQDGMVHMWLLSSSTAVRDRPAPAHRVWSARIDERVAQSAGGPLPSGCCMAVDSGWQGKQPRPASIAVGLEDGSLRIYTDINVESSVDQAPAVVTVPSQSRARVQTLRLDVARHLSILIHRQDQAFFERLDLRNGVCSSTTFGHRADHLGALTAFATDFVVMSTPTAPTTPMNEGRIVSVTVGGTTTPLDELSSSDSASLDSSTPSFGHRPFVVGGDAHGRTFIWDWLADEPSEAGIIVPHRMIQGFESRVTALAVTEAVVFVGSLDGTVRCFDILTSTLLRTFKDRAAPRLPSRMLAQGLIADEDRWQVSHIRASRDAMVAAVGGRIIAWKIGIDAKRKSHAVGKLSARSERYRSDLELRREVQESLETLSAEQRDRLERLGQEQRVAIEYGLPPSLDNMTEDEAVALAMMLSVEDEEARWFSDSLNPSAAASPSFGPVSGDLLGMDGLSLDEDESYVRSRSFGNQRSTWDDLDDNYDYEDKDEESDSNALSVPTSPTLRGASLGNGSPSSAGRSISYSWRPASTHSSPSFSAYQPPRPSSSSGLGGTSKIQVSPRLGPTYGSQIAAGPVPDMSQELWPAAGAANATLSASVSPPRAPTTRGWSDVARARTPAQAPRPSGSSPSLAGSSVRDWRRAERESMQDELRRREDEELSQDNRTM